MPAVQKKRREGKRKKTGMANAKLFTWHANTLKDVQRKKLIDTECENNINTVAEEIVSAENVVGIFGCIIISAVNDGWSIPPNFS